VLLLALLPHLLALLPHLLACLALHLLLTIAALICVLVGSSSSLHLHLHGR
jgi:hypothetical protein